MLILFLFSFVFIYCLTTVISFHYAIILKLIILAFKIIFFDLLCIIWLGIILLFSIDKVMIAVSDV